MSVKKKGIETKMKTRNTKSVLLRSALALLLCVTMLVGTTFAWFTDNVTSANNIIKTGNLDVEMYYADGTKAVPADDSEEWKNAQGATIYTANQLWEPGYTDAKHIKIANEGTLALKYQLAIIPTGEISTLAEVIDVYLYEIADTDANAIQVENRTDLDESMYVGTLADVISQGIVQGNLAADSDYTTTIVLKMQESADNTYNVEGGFSLGDFTIQLLATQYTAESDSFGTDYDADAWMPGMQVYTASDLQAAINAGEDVTLMNDIVLDEQIVIPAPTARAIDPTVIDLNGNKITNANGSVIRNEGDLVIKGKGTIESTADTSYAIRVQQGSLVVDSADVEVKGAFGAVSVFNGAEVTLNGGNYYAEGVNPKTSHTIYIGGYGTINICGGSFYRGATGDSGAVICGYGWSNDANEKAVINISGGTVDCATAWGWISNYDGAWTTISITGGTFGRNPASYVADGFAAVENNGAYYVVSDTIDNVITTADDLVNAFANLNAGDVLYIAADLDMTGKTITPVTGNKGFTMYGNGNTISNLNTTAAALFVDHSGSSSYTFDGVVLENCSVNSTTNYGALFVGDGDTSDAITITNCVAKNCNVTSAKYAAAFVAYTAGYDVQNNGPVYSDVLVENCSVIGGSITGGGSTGAAVGHAGGNVDTTTTISNFTVDGVAINGEDAEHTGAIVGTAHIGETIINNSTYKNVTGNYNGLCGRFVPNSTGTLLIDGKQYVANGLLKDIDANVYYVSNANGLETINAMMTNGSAGKEVVVNLTDDIDFTGKTWTPVDAHYEFNFSLKEFNGNGHTISNLTVNGPAMFTRFVCYSDDTMIKDVTFDNAIVNGNGSINAAILINHAYSNVTLDNVDVKNSAIAGNYKVATLIGTVYDESTGSTVTATLKNCDVSNITVTSNLDFMATGMIAFVYESNNDYAVFENCTVTDVTIVTSSKGYNAVAAVYCNDGSAEGSFNVVDGVVVNNIVFQ